MSVSEAAAEVYDLLLCKHMDAARKRDEPLRQKLFALVLSFEEIFPKECAAWNARFAKCNGKCTPGDYADDCPRHGSWVNIVP